MPEIGDLDKLELPGGDTKYAQVEQRVRELIEWADEQPPETWD